MDEPIHDTPNGETSDARAGSLVEARRVEAAESSFEFCVELVQALMDGRVAMSSSGDAAVEVFLFPLQFGHTFALALEPVMEGEGVVDAGKVLFQPGLLGGDGSDAFGLVGDVCARRTVELFAELGAAACLGGTGGLKAVEPTCAALNEFFCLGDLFDDAVLLGGECKGRRGLRWGLQTQPAGVLVAPVGYAGATARTGMKLLLPCKLRGLSGRGSEGAACPAGRARC
ncbi:hypothetical protein [Actinacidiphila oryziradicis]|uniref:Uncharacterized protein n=1 Tax=Actinacidiphila oryziradicis TaxID=2571141 RepID=A0A4U0RPG2_9ACTN|nr:hypothetical protein [Actinacidiphila oryziradicis]TJZ97811.1 hypothetical protein FCI23_49295 [Actinacidiphila oryziradicis]